MCKIDGPMVGLPADDAVLRAREHFDDAIELLRVTKDRIRSGEIAGIRDVASQVALVIKALVVLGEARGKIDELARDDGRRGSFALDLAAARIEIGGRLDRLRAARGA